MLKQIKKNYDDCERELDEMEMKNLEKRNEMVKMKVLGKDLAKKVELYQIILEQGASLEMRKKQLKWIQVHKAEKKLKLAMKEKDKLAEKVKSHKDAEKKFELEIKKYLQMVEITAKFILHDESFNRM